MLAFSGQAILLDIEGTVAPIAYVFDVMFPFARREVRPFLAERMERPEVLAAAKQIAVDAGFSDFEALVAKERETSPGVDPASRVAANSVSNGFFSAGLSFASAAFAARR